MTKASDRNNLKKDRFVLAMASIMPVHHSGEGMVEQRSSHYAAKKQRKEDTGKS
jgi:hypothetical protein